MADLVGPAHVGLGLDIGFGEPGLDDNPPAPFDPSHWWPDSEGYGAGISGMRYAPSETWQTLPACLRALGMTAGDIDGVLGGNMARMARHVREQTPT